MPNRGSVFTPRISYSLQIPELLPAVASGLSGDVSLWGLLCDPPWLPGAPKKLLLFNDFYTFLTIVSEVPWDFLVQSQGRASVSTERGPFST